MQGRNAAAVHYPPLFFKKMPPEGSVSDIVYFAACLHYMSAQEIQVFDGCPALFCQLTNLLQLPIHNFLPTRHSGGMFCSR